MNNAKAFLLKFLQKYVHSVSIYVLPSCLLGHLKLVQCLLTCEGVDKTKLMSLIHTLLDEFLFPTSKLERSSDCRDSLTDYSPK